MRSIKLFGKDLSLFLVRFVTTELISILLAGLLFWALRENAGGFRKCLRDGAFIISLIDTCLLGIEFFSALVRNRWRFKAADKEYPMYRALFLILINAVICPLMINSPRGYFILIIPCVTWIMQIIISTLYRWLH